MSIRKMMLACVAATVLAGCQDPHQHQVSADVSKIDADTKAAIQKLSSDEQRLLMAFEARNSIAIALGNYKGPDSVTIAQALDEQRKFEQELAKQKAEAEALKAKIESEQQALAKKLADTVSVALLAKDFSPSAPSVGQYDDQIEYKIAFDNKGDKDIAGIKGVAVFSDMFGDVISRMGMSVTDTIKAHSHYVWGGYTHFNQFEEKDLKLRSTPYEKIKFDFEPRVVVFTDGTKLSTDDLDIPPAP